MMDDLPLLNDQEHLTSEEQATQHMYVVYVVAGRARQIASQVQARWRELTAHALCPDEGD